MKKYIALVLAVATLTPLTTLQGMQRRGGWQQRGWEQESSLGYDSSYDGMGGHSGRRPRVAGIFRDRYGRLNPRRMAIAGVGSTAAIYALYKLYKALPPSEKGLRDRIGKLLQNMGAGTKEWFRNAGRNTRDWFKGTGDDYPSLRGRIGRWLTGTNKSLEEVNPVLAARAPEGVTLYHDHRLFSITMNSIESSLDAAAAHNITKLYNDILSTSNQEIADAMRSFSRGFYILMQGLFLHGGIRTSRAKKIRTLYALLATTEAAFSTHGSEEQQALFNEFSKELKVAIAPLLQGITSVMPSMSTIVKMLLAAGVIGGIAYGGSKVKNVISSTPEVRDWLGDVATVAALAPRRYAAQLRNDAGGLVPEDGGLGSADGGYGGADGRDPAYRGDAYQL